MSHREHGPSEAERQEMWIEQEEGYQKLLRLEHESADVVFGGDLLESAVSKVPTAIVCDDERVWIQEPTVVELAIAGTTVLMSDEEVEQTVLKMKAAGIDLEQLEVTCHDGCGACAHSLTLHADDPRSQTEVERDAAERFRRACGSRKSVKRIGYAEETAEQYKMEGRIEFHPARAMIIDGTGRLNTGMLHLLEAFLLSVRYHPNEVYAKKEIGIIAGIPMGDHGFGQERYKTDKPLLVVLVGDPHHSDMSTDALRGLVQPIMEQYGRAIKLLEFTAPNYESR